MNCFDWIQSPLIILLTYFCQSMKLFPLRKDQTEKRCQFWQPTRLTQPWRTSNQRAGTWLIRRTSGLQLSFCQSLMDTWCIHLLTLMCALCKWIPQLQDTVGVDNLTLCSSRNLSPGEIGEAGKLEKVLYTWYLCTKLFLRPLRLGCWNSAESPSGPVIGRTFRMWNYHISSSCGCATLSHRRHVNRTRPSYKAFRKTG